MCDDYTCAELLVLARTYEADADLGHSTAPAVANILTHVTTCDHEYCASLERDDDLDDANYAHEIVHFALHEC